MRADPADDVGSRIVRVGRCQLVVEAPDESVVLWKNERDQKIRGARARRMADEAGSPPIAALRVVEPVRDVLAILGVARGRVELVQRRGEEDLDVQPGRDGT